MDLIHKPALWTVDQVARMIGSAPLGGIAGKAIVGRFSTAAPVTIPGDVYLPMQGPPERKANAVARAVSLGAAAVIVPRTLSFPRETPALYVRDPMAALRRMAVAGRRRFSGQIVAVTGSVGKTTTKDMISHVLAYAGPTHLTHANFNSGFAIVATIASLPPAARYSVMEIAMVTPDSVKVRSAIARPHVGVITSIGHSHGMYQSAGSSILESKMKLFDNLEPGGTAVVPSSSAAYEKMIDMLKRNPRVGRVVSCGEREDDDVRLKQCEQYPTYSALAVEVYGGEIGYVVGQPGPQFVFNSLLAVGTLAATGVPLDTIQSLSNFVPTHRRVERFRVVKDGAPFELIDDAYNAAPDSVRGLLHLLKNRPETSRRVLVLGDMLELGPAEGQLHAELASDVVDSGVDLLITVGPLARLVAEGISGRIATISFPDAGVALSEVPALLKPYDLVAVKGSNATNLGLLVNRLRGGMSLPRQGIGWSIERETPASRREGH
jgi:UDP-N-acetylmuramoyl-tripeptide--D-alanyl-D-alanine ligase